MRKVLVVEDTAEVLEQIVEILELEGFAVLTATNGIDGLRLAREELPDLIICDIMMPELDGYEVLQELRNDSSTATIPFIFLTSKTERESMRKGMELGADDYVTKPFNLDELLAAARTRLEKQDALEKERLRSLSHHLVKAQEAERRQIARELHDEVGHILTSLKMILGSGKRLPPEEMYAKLDEAQALVNEMMTRISELSLNLRPPILDDLGLLPTLLQYFKRYTTQSQIRVSFRHTGIERRFSREVETASYRIIQEALTNIARHTSVQDAFVHVWADEEALRILVEDRGEGFVHEAALGLGDRVGLAGMHEWAALLGGRLTVISSPQEGTRVMAQLPIAPALETSKTTLRALPILESPEVLASPNKPVAPHGEIESESRIIEIVLADSHALTRRGLRSLLEPVTSFSILAEATTKQETLALVERLHPDVLILDLDIGLDLVENVVGQGLPVNVLVLSAYDTEAYVLEALKKGAKGFALKDSSADDLIQAVQQVALGQRYLSQSLADRVIDFYVNAQEAEDISLGVYGALTSREREVFQMVINGAKNAEIAQALYISQRTVETHRSNMMRKLGLRTQADLIRYAMQHGLIRTKG